MLVWQPQALDDPASLRLVYGNRAAGELLHFDVNRRVGESIFSIFPDAPLERVQVYAEVCRSRGARDLGIVRDAKGGPPLAIRVCPLLGTAVAVIFEDAELAHQIEERLRAERALADTEAQLRQAQKMEAVGRLAGGVAHDFNNILSAILSYASLALAELGPREPLRAELKEVVAAAERAGQLTRQLLAFSRRQILEPRVVDLNEVIDKLYSMLRRLIGEDIELYTDAAQDLRSIKVDVGQIEQVVMNLAVNARDAMPRGGRLTLRTANVRLSEEAAKELELLAGDYVALTVEDTGSGMDATTLSRVFEPFFTTKEQGKGTGLGLSTVFGIVKQSGGSVRVTSQPGQGASFTIYLPSVDGRPAAPSQASTRPPPRSNQRTTILVVEDNEPVRRVVLDILRRAGYPTLEASTASDALALGARPEIEIDLLLTDVVMPGMSGPALADRLRALRPGLRVLCMSGYSDDAIFNHGIVDADLAFIQKPIAPDTLLAKVREVLETPIG